MSQLFCQIWHWSWLSIKTTYFLFSQFYWNDSVGWIRTLELQIANQLIYQLHNCYWPPVKTAYFHLQQFYWSTSVRCIGTLELQIANQLFYQLHKCYWHPVKTTYLHFSQILKVPVLGRFKPLNFRLWINYSTNCYWQPVKNNLFSLFTILLKCQCNIR